MNVEQVHKSQQDFFKTRQTVDVSYRIKCLKRLKIAIETREKDIYKALATDLSKSEFEAFLTEYNVIIEELKNYIYKTNKLSLPKKVRPSILNFPSRSKRYPEPYGNTLIISPWNYPFQLALGPLIGAIAAGNTVLLKPSEFTTATSQLIKEIIEEAFEKGHVYVLLGDAQIAQKLTALPWNYIFFTGSPAVGKKIYQAAAKHLTPVTLELGGKNPCVVDNTAQIKVAAKRIVWGKFLNAGQTCIAPDYLLVHNDVKEKLIKEIKNQIYEFFGSEVKTSPDLPRIIKNDQFDRLIEMLENETVLEGGDYDRASLYLAPTLIDEPSRDSKVMQEEIFGPILPVISFENKEDLELWIDSYEKPLGAYCFTSNSKFEKWFLNRFSFGGGVINDSIVQFINDRLPFGGVGNSGIGSYHGEKTFETFSHYKSVVHRGTWIDLPLKYAPYKGKLKTVKKLLQWL
ncbi:aldehyde dehydrogenase [uncultured Nonlabens sp.]|uniref:aldehyde dehydrogenase n=1 Tax=uncultured Nonlabens sp. TaxID=859306 RepID=UPI00261B0114|nr:aldehyde dehydrogenase [uncultured Nonlabens sp.]